MQITDSTKRKIIAIVVVLVILSIGFWGQSQNTGTTSSSPSSTTSTKTSSSSSQWTKKKFVDEFGDSTDQAYISLNSNKTGTFSNSATTNSSLKWQIIITTDYVGFVLYEYGWSQVKGFQSYPDTYQVSIKESDGTITTISAKNYADRVMTTTTSDYQKLINILKKEKEIKISIKETGSAASSSYNLGSFNCSGFKSVYNTLKTK